MLHALGGLPLLLLVASAGTAQRLVSARWPTAAAERAIAPASAARDTQPPSSSGAIVGSILGVAAGTFGGALLTVAAVCHGDPLDCQDDTAVIFTWGLSEALVAALGTHIGNRYAGNFGLDLLVASGIAVGGLAAANAANNGVVLIPAAVVQVATLVLVERAVGARRPS